MEKIQSVSRYQRWSVVIIGFFTLSIAFSARAALGLIMPVWQREFGWSSSYISSVGAAALIVMAIVAPFAGRLVDRHGPAFTLNLGLGMLGVGCALVAMMEGKLMFVLGFAGFSAVGFGIVATHVVATAMARTFNENVGLATGIATSGSTGGQFVIVPLIAVVLAFVSWRWSFGALAVASLLLIPCILAGLKKEKGEDHPDFTQHTQTSSMHSDFLFIIRRPAFHILFWSFLICGFTTVGVIETHLLPFASFCGFPTIPRAAAYGILSGVNLLGMITAGWLTDRVNRPLLLAGIYFLRSLTFIILAGLPGSSIDTLFVFALLFGAVDYATIPVTASLVASHVGLKVMGLAMGLISAGHAIGGASGAYLGGYVFDTTGDYTMLWLSSIGIAVGAGVLVLFVAKAEPQPVTA